MEISYATMTRHFTEVITAGTGAEHVMECTICWGLVVDSSRKLHLDYHAKRGEFDANES